MDENKIPGAELTGDTAEEVTKAAVEGAEEVTEAAAGEVTEAVDEEAAQAGDALAETADAEASENTDISDELKELQDAAAKMQPVKKKRTLMVPIIISLCIVIVAAAAAILLTLFFNKSIEGCWYHEQEVPTSYAQSTDDEPETVKIGYYFKFDSDGKMTYYNGDISSVGTYTFKAGESNSDNTVDLNFYMPSSGYVNQSFKVEISGNIFTGQTMKLSSTNSETEGNSLDFVKKDYVAPELKRDGDFVADKEIEAKWVTSMQGYGEKYVESYEMKSDGTFNQSTAIQIDSQLSGAGKDLEYTVNLSGIYSCQKGKLEMVYEFMGDRQKQEIPYTVKEKGNVLTLSLAQDVDYYKVGTPSADEALAAKATEPPTEAAAEATTQKATEKK